MITFTIHIYTKSQAFICCLFVFACFFFCLFSFDFTGCQKQNDRDRANNRIKARIFRVKYVVFFLYSFGIIAFILNEKFYYIDWSLTKTILKSKKWHLVKRTHNHQLNGEEFFFFYFLVRTKLNLLVDGTLVSFLVGKFSFRCLTFSFCFFCCVLFFLLSNNNTYEKKRSYIDGLSQNNNIKNVLHHFTAPVVNVKDLRTTVINRYYDEFRMAWR